MMREKCRSTRNMFELKKVCRNGFNMEMVSKRMILRVYIPEGGGARKRKTDRSWNDRLKPFSDLEVNMRVDVRCA